MKIQELLIVDEANQVVSANEFWDWHKKNSNSLGAQAKKEWYLNRKEEGLKSRLAMDYFINENEDSDDPFSHFLEN
jgi:hypothetical protein